MRLLSVLAFAAGLAGGVAIGFPVSRTAVDLLIHPQTAPPSTTASSPPAGGGATPTPAAATPSVQPVLSPSPALSSQPCPPLTAGQSSLDPLPDPPDGYRTESSLDWLGCGSIELPSFTMPASWLLALSFTCPVGTASASARPTASASGGPTVSVVVAASGDSPAVAIALSGTQGDHGDTLSSSIAGSSFTAGAHRLRVAAPTACLWHVAVYPSTA